MAKKKASRQKKMNTRVDFTPMVDMMMLLITFFMLCTSLAKPQTMNLTMPSNDENISEQEVTVFVHILELRHQIRRIKTWLRKKQADRKK